jgi:type IV pilus assembly protein PilC
MATFSYQAISETGTTISGEIEAGSEELASEKLLGMGAIPIKVSLRATESRLTRFFDSLKRIGKVSPSELILFTKQFRSMLRAGIPLPNTLEVLEVQTENQRLKQAVTSMRYSIKEGKSLHHVFSQHPGIFSQLYCGMIRAGERSGNLPEVLDRLIYLIDHSHRTTVKVKGALRYPAIVVIALAGAFIFLQTTVVPKFVGIFQKANISLPLPTKILIVLNNIIQNYWYIVLGGLGTAIVLAFVYFRTERGKVFKDRMILKLPLVGPLFQKAAMSRFASIFSILTSSGLLILDAIDILEDVIGNAAIAREISRLKDLIRQGRGIAGPLRSAKYFPPMVVSMTAIGEESGSLDLMLSEIAKHYDDELDYGLEKLSGALGPLLIVCLAFVVGFFALAIFLPMWDLTKIAGR